jgi:hypothetical protein
MGKKVVVCRSHQQADEFIMIPVMVPLGILGQEVVGDVDMVEAEVEVKVVVVGWILYLGMQ